ncbi:GNAT family N-acetyltransferase [Accumulibacter sp.]|uniref:GNAT family N-acetyltransferase n=1 Tax=Accumulibacter sp. TaxID=2053492 RepID=UPI0025D6C803|nr:GNAT family N-acetyltransferase [Accumulibacter sp.]MCM8596879.1 GNAT family N-acetyltransferase [Accumulibacter sp.]MCM8624587.1 GNAT family N-acetyltransferase [Accumulibacter sp.]MDS4051027.1 GNAT family N-acetyltransferase [Accumulibacter sp.]
MSTVSRLTWQNEPASALQRKPDLLAAWDRLNAERGDLPFLSASAVLSALDVFGQGNERLLVGREGGRIVTLFLLRPLGRCSWVTFQPSQIPLGAWVASADRSLPELAQSLTSGPLGLCLMLSITRIDPLFSPRGDDSRCVLSSDYIDTGWIELHGTFDEYWNARGKNLRQNMRKQRNRLAAEGVATRLRTLSDPSEMAGGVERYGLIESAGWKAAQGSAIHPENAQGRFYRRLLETAAEHGEAVIYEYLFGERVVASNLCLRRPGTLVILKTTYDESLSAYSPAFLLHQEVIAALYADQHIDRIEYYGRMVEWHTRWTGSRRTLYHLTVYRWPLIRKIADWYRSQGAPKSGENSQ